jgi:hypothetical protein
MLSVNFNTCIVAAKTIGPAIPVQRFRILLRYYHVWVKCSRYKPRSK